jgi:anaerobic ribonucleoside-triphosphate reductase activating protein
MRDEFSFPENLLNLASVCPSTKALGPGNRLVIWTQGCYLDCLDCCAQEWRKLKHGIQISPESLAQEILKNKTLEGITISGGEPMLQPKVLNKLLKIIKDNSNLGIICYTGYKLEELRKRNDLNINDFIEKIDVLIDGMYIKELDDNQGWRGSSNQAINFITGRYKEYEIEFLNRKRDIEIHLFKDNYLMVGIKPRWADELINIQGI